MRWSYADLMDLPAELYDELVRFLTETHHAPQLDD